MKELVYHDMPQGSDEWFECRIGKITGSSRIQQALSGLELGKKGEPLEKAIKVRESLITTIANEFLTDEQSDQDKNFFENIHIKRGNRCEPDARNLYSLLNNVEVKEVGFVEKDWIVGFSPDGFVEENGMIEIKCPDSNSFLGILFKEKTNQELDVPKIYYIQMQYGLWITGREWCDYCVYNEKYSHFHSSGLLQKRIIPDLDLFAEFESAIKYYKARINELMRTIKKDS